MGKRLGLIIGVNHYQDTTFRPLQFAETDARALAQWLVHGRGGQWNPANVQLVLGSEVTRELMETVISQLCLQMAAPDDLILIYFAGYAFVDQTNGEGYLAYSDTRYQQSGSGLHLFSLVSQIMARSPAAQILYILDAFQFGPAWSKQRSSPFDYTPLFGSTLLNGLQQIPGRLFYCTCRGNEMVPETGEKNLGSFMYRLIMGVGNSVSDPVTQQITLQRLHTFLSERLSVQQKPQVFGQENRPVILVGEMPSVGQNALHGPGTVPPSGPLRSGPIPASPATFSAAVPASPSGNTRSGGQATMTTIEQNIQQQCLLMLETARQQVQMQNLEQAYQITETILHMAPQFADALILKAQILAAITHFQEALECVKQVVQIAPENALGWSMAAALLANTGQYLEAMSAVDRSLSIDPTNSETVSIKEMISEKLAEVQFDTGKRSRLVPPPPQRPHDSARSFFLSVGIQILALALGIAGASLELVMPSVPKLAAFILESVSMALLVVVAWRGSYLYGFKRFLMTFFFSAVAAGTLGALYVFKPAYNFILHRLENSFALLTPLIFLILWLVAAAILPFLAALVGWIVGAIVRARRK